MKTKDYKIRLLPETNQVLITAKNYAEYIWMIKQIKDVNKINLKNRGVVKDE